MGILVSEPSSFGVAPGIYFPAPALKPATALKVEDIVLKKSFLELFKKCLK